MCNCIMENMYHNSTYHITIKNHALHRHEPCPLFCEVSTPDPAGAFEDTDTKLLTSSQVTPPRGEGPCYQVLRYKNNN